MVDRWRERSHLCERPAAARGTGFSLAVRALHTTHRHAREPRWRPG